MTSFPTPLPIRAPFGNRPSSPSRTIPSSALTALCPYSLPRLYPRAGPYFLLIPDATDPFLHVHPRTLYIDLRPAKGIPISVFFGSPFAGEHLHSCIVCRLIELWIPLCSDSSARVSEASPRFRFRSHPESPSKVALTAVCYCSKVKISNLGPFLLTAGPWAGPGRLPALLGIV